LSSNLASSYSILMIPPDGSFVHRFNRRLVFDNPVPSRAYENLVDLVMGIYGKDVCKDRLVISFVRDKNGEDPMDTTPVTCASDLMKSYNQLRSNDELSISLSFMLPSFVKVKCGKL